jgi:catalase-peroxidase
MDHQPGEVGQQLPGEPVRYEWELTKSPPARISGRPRAELQRAPCRMRTIPRRSTRPPCSRRISLRIDPSYEKISRRFLENPEEFADAFAKAWFKLTHRDMGPLSRYLGPLVPKEPLIWQDPVPAVDHELIGEQDIAALKAKVLGIRLSISATGHDGLGVGFNVPRQRQARRGQRGAHSPGAAEGLGSQPAGRTGEGARQKLEAIQKEFNCAQSGGKKVSLADLIVLGGCAAVEEAAKKAGHDVKVPFSPGRTDASQEQTDVHSFAVLEPMQTVSATTSARDTRDQRRSCWWTRRTC